MHVVEFISFWYVPGRQMVWKRLPSLPLGQADPAGQTNHAVALQVYPPGQCIGADMPYRGHQYPAGQPMHCDTLRLPALLEKVPRGQGDGRVLAYVDMGNMGNMGNIGKMGN